MQDLSLRLLLFYIEIRARQAELFTENSTISMLMLNRIFIYQKVIKNLDMSSNFGTNENIKLRNSFNHKILSHQLC